MEINYADAEGRPVLTETPALAHEKRQDFVVMMATLTDPARVAVRVDLHR